MALKAIANKEEFSSLGENIQVHYSPDTDNPDVFRLSVTPSDGIELSNVSGLKTALQKERGQVSTLKSSLSSFDGFNAEEARTAISELEILKKDGGGNKTRDEVRTELDASYKTKFDADRDVLTKKFSLDIDVKDKKISSLSRQLEKHLIDNSAVSAINEAGGATELLVPIIRSNTAVVTLENGNLAIRVIDENGQERMSPKAGSSDPMTINEYVSELKNDSKFARAFSASKHSGSGATGGGDIETSNAIVLSQEAAKDPVKYRSAREKALKQGKQLQFAD